MKKLLALLLLVSSFAFGGSVTGQIQTATSGPIVNGTLTFTLTQAAVQVGSASIATTAVSCYTDRGGNIAGQPDPLVAPIVTTNTGSGTLAAGTYFTEFTYYDASGTSFGSFETTTVLSSTGTLIVAPPVRQPATATGWKIFISTASGTETLQSTQVGFGSSYQQSSALAAGTALPVSNTSVCKILFNDQLIPSFTGYNVSFVNSSGSNVSGYPQKWYLSGGAAGTINVSSGTPLYSGVIQYPQAIISNPAFNATQSINGPLNLNGFGMLGINALGITGNLTVGGSITAGSYTNNLSAFAATTSAQFLGVISDETGTGLVVGNNAPTFIAPVLGAATATSLTTGQIIQPAATALTIKDSSAGTRASIPSNGTGQGTLNNWTLIGASSANNTTLVTACKFDNAAAIVGTGADANIFNCTFPANVLAAGKCFHTRGSWQHTTGAAAVTYKFTFGAQTQSAAAEAGTGVVTWDLDICNKNGVTNAQTITGIAGFDGVTTIFGNIFLAGTNDMTTGITLKFTFSVAATDQVTPLQMDTWLDQ